MLYTIGEMIRAYDWELSQGETVSIQPDPPVVHETKKPRKPRPGGVAGVYNQVASYYGRIQDER